MATYKVPQDVEADDKLIGPFSFRQFIYLIIVALSGAAAWGLSQVFIGLAIIPLPIILLFGALALPLRKDQPMEIYLAAIISFYLKPHKRLWDPDGIDTLIEITVPKIVNESRVKDITQADAEQRFGYLADIVDSQGWSIRNTPNIAMNSDILLEAQGATDVLAADNSISQSFNTMMSVEADRMREEAIQRMREPVTPAEPVVAAVQAPDPAVPDYNPYPTNIQQAMIQPIDDPYHAYTTPANEPVAQTPVATSDKPVSADIMNLANNADISIETIAHEANRLQRKSDVGEEVVISLR